MLIYQNNSPPSCQQRQSFLSLTTKYLLQATSPLSLPSSHCSDSGEAQNETPKSVRCTHLKTILLFSMVKMSHLINSALTQSDVSAAGFWLFDLTNIRFEGYFIFNSGRFYVDLGKFYVSLDFNFSMEFTWNRFNKLTGESSVNIFPFLKKPILLANEVSSMKWVVTKMVFIWLTAKHLKYFQIFWR